MKLPVPSVPDMARLKGSNRASMTASLRAFYEAEGAIFNYISGTRSVKTGYRGLHNLPQLVAGCSIEKTAQGKKSNEEIVWAAAPLAFDRNLSVFDLPRRQFSFGREFLSSYRIPFFFVEQSGETILPTAAQRPRAKFRSAVDDRDNPQAVSARN